MGIRRGKQIHDILLYALLYCLNFYKCAAFVKTLKEKNSTVCSHVTLFKARIYTISPSYSSLFFRANSSNCAFNITTFWIILALRSFSISTHTRLSITLQKCFNFFYILHKPSRPLLPSMPPLSLFFFIANFIHPDCYQIPSINF